MKIVIANLKMNLLNHEIANYLTYLKDHQPTQVLTIFAPTSIYLKDFKEYNACGQNSFDKLSGAYTGEISPTQLKSIGVNYCLVGHSERRKHFFEDNALINRKLQSLESAAIKPILCIGETLEEKNSDKTKEVLMTSLNEALVETTGDIIIAYEPIWAIGTGLTPSLEEINTTLLFIKDYLKTSLHKDYKVLYGGSVDGTNLESIINLEHCDGVLVGSFSTKYQEFIDLINKL